MCYQCPFACEERVGDITIGDYHWAVEYHPDLKNKNGKKKYSISCLLINTMQGEHLLNEVKEQFDLYPTKIEWIEERNKNLIRPTLRPKERDTIYKDIKKYGYLKWASKYYISWAYFKNLFLGRVLIRIVRKVRGFMESFEGRYI